MAAMRMGVHQARDHGLASNVDDVRARQEAEGKA